MSATITLDLSDQSDELARLATAIQELAEGEDWPADVAFQINLCLDELTTNVVKYAHADDGSRKIHITLASDPDLITIEMMDNGPPFDPLHDAPQPDLEASLEARRIGGLGIHFVRTLMDEVRYRREQDRNHLTMIKRRSA